MAGGSGLTRDTISLTHRSIESLRPAGVPYRISDQRCIGLAVRVAPSGIKTWDLAYRIRGSAKVRRVSLGRVTDVSLEKARERANELTSAARTGCDLDRVPERGVADAGWPRRFPALAGLVRSPWPAIRRRDHRSRRPWFPASYIERVGRPIRRSVPGGWRQRA
jgi:hypothetical protein